MSSFDMTKITASLPIRDPGGQPAAPRPDTATNHARSDDGGVTVEASVGLSASQPPVDGDRVAQIRSALQQGNYPILPTEIADAVIAAKLMLSSGE
ncbi:hypothetical protein HME9302_00346 [Alteripontixanthobacter maritimus]|uniref:Anti-sigma-28 factor FlgM C-terminal domain-containing protein n=1 Tax=Alteripontixanthobacter maritimus TaxID=2161824 RepID=A0A369Q2N6_9SPHN|nr:flagellar biosynthesis anti-sigma factor FlgM [Alteripontixanthobacter maritimus]RDC59161.1 hypothetical protein HME9302_00346 [Alteripontixanthobacter maritimus]